MYPRYPPHTAKDRTTDKLTILLQKHPEAFWFRIRGWSGKQWREQAVSVMRGLHMKREILICAWIARRIIPLSLCNYSSCPTCHGQRLDWILTSCFRGDRSLGGIKNEGKKLLILRMTTRIFFGHNYKEFSFINYAGKNIKIQTSVLLISFALQYKRIRVSLKLFSWRTLTEPPLLPQSLSKLCLLT